MYHVSKGVTIGHQSKLMNGRWKDFPVDQKPWQTWICRAIDDLRELELSQESGQMCQWWQQAGSNGISMWPDASRTWDSNNNN